MFSIVNRVLGILIVFIICLLSAACAGDTSKLFLGSEVTIVDSPRVAIVLKTMNEHDKSNIFRLAKSLFIEMEGFYIKRSFTLGVSPMAKEYVSESITVFANREYRITKAYLMDANGSIIAACPVIGSVYADYVSSALPQTVVAKKVGTVNFMLTFVPTLDGDVRLTGYDFSTSPPPTLPFIKFEIKVLDANNFGNPVPAEVRIRTKSNNLLIAHQIKSSGVLAFQFHYFADDDAYTIEAEGYTKNGTKTYSDTKTAKFLFDAYGQTNKALEIRLR